MIPALPLLLTFGAAALQAGGSLMQARGQANSMEAQAARSRRAAEIGKIKADQTDAALNDELVRTLDNVETIRASQGMSSDSPSAIAYAELMASRTDEQRRMRRANAMIDVAEAEDAARIYQGQARQALNAGYVNALTGIASAASRAYGVGSR